MNQNPNEVTFGRAIGTAMQCLAVAVPLLLLVHAPAHAAAPTCEPAYASSLDARFAAKADTGPAALRRFVDRTRMIYQIDMATAVERAERHRAAVAACTPKVAARS